jgi:cyclase
MLRPRIIPCLLVHKGGLVKTVKFTAPKYVGDPINAVRIFNEKEADELIVVDIDASVESREPDFEMIKNLATECRMPLCYGGGIKTVSQASRIVSLGVEKVAISSVALETPGIVSAMAKELGNQSVVVVLDVKKRVLGSSYDVYTHNGKRNTKRSPFELAREMDELGAGEIVINSIDRDGKMNGYDLELAKGIREVIRSPLTVLGGAGSLEDIRALIDCFGLIGACAGSYFVFKGKFRAVLISYPSMVERNNLAKCVYG